MDEYSSFGVWLSSSRLGETESATRELKEYLANRQISNSDDWPSQIGRFLTDQITSQELLTAAQSADTKKDKEQHCEAYFYIGSKRLIAGDKAGAAASFEKCVATGVHGFSEYQTAKVELRLLENAN
jgi:lipoprotein NlpI